MKKTAFLISSFLFLVSSFSFLAIPTHAFNLLDFLFPPVQMKPAERDTPKESLAPEVPSNDTYSNTLKEDTINCQGTVGLSKHWDPEKKETGTTNANGQPVEEFVPYDAKDLEGEMDVKNLSNDYYRNFQSFFARGGVKCTEEKAQKYFNSLSMDGSSASVRNTPYTQVLYSRGQFLSEVALSLYEGDPKYDTVVQDYQIAWSCSGTCQELTNQKVGNCRPIFASELIYGLQNEKVYYSSPTAEASTFPGNIIGAVNSHYSNGCGNGDYGCYKDRSGGKAFSPLSKDLYKLMFKQINFVPKGNVDNEVKVIRYDGYDMAAKQKINPSPTIFHRTLPNAGAANGKEAQKSLSYVNPTEQENLPNANLCDSVKVNSETARDQPVQGLISLFVHGIFKHVPAGESHDQSETNEVTSTYDNQVVPNTQTAEQAFSNMIPDQVLKKQDLINQEFSSKTTTNQNYPIPDPGYRANLLYREMLSLLRPSNWF